MVTTVQAFVERRVRLSRVASASGQRELPGTRCPFVFMGLGAKLVLIGIQGVCAWLAQHSLHACEDPQQPRPGCFVFDLVGSLLNESHKHCL